MSFLIAIVIYFVPTAIGMARGHLSTGGIFLLNLLLGWTVIGWIVALIWAFSANTKKNATLLSRLPEQGRPAKSPRPGELEMAAYYEAKKRGEAQ